MISFGACARNDMQLLNPLSTKSLLDVQVEMLVFNQGSVLCWRNQFIQTQSLNGNGYMEFSAIIKHRLRKNPGSTDVSGINTHSW